MNKFFEFFKTLFNLTDEQIEQAQLELNKEQKTDIDTQNSQENKEKEQKTTETVENVDTTTENTENTEKENIEGDSVNREDYMKIQEELKAVKALLEKTTKERDSEKRANRIKNVEGCLDYDLLTSLLTDVEDKDLDTKIESLRKEKSYLFKKPETEGFNPATPQNTMGGVEAAFLELNPDIKL